jgi:hypothetical protein
VGRKPEAKPCTEERESRRRRGDLGEPAQEGERGNLAFWDTVDEDMAEVVAARQQVSDRPAPETYVTGYCFDTDILSATIRPAPPLHVIRRLPTVPPQAQFTTSIMVSELIYGARRVGREDLSRLVEQVVHLDRALERVDPRDPQCVALSARS